MNTLSPRFLIVRNCVVTAGVAAGELDLATDTEVVFEMERVEADGDAGGGNGSTNVYAETVYEVSSTDWAVPRLYLVRSLSGDLMRANSAQASDRMTNATARAAGRAPIFCIAIQWCARVLRSACRFCVRLWSGWNWQ